MNCCLARGLPADCSPQLQPLPSRDSCALGLPRACSLAQPQCLPEGSGREHRLAPDKPFVAWNSSAPLHASPRGDISTAWKTLSVAVQKNSSIHVFVAITAIHFCADFKLDIWISQLLCAHAKEIPNHLEYTREPTPSSFAFHLIRAHFCCNLGFEVQVQFSWTSLKLLNGARYNVPHFTGKKHVSLLWEW